MNDVVVSPRNQLHRHQDDKAGGMTAGPTNVPARHATEAVHMALDLTAA